MTDARETVRFNVNSSDRDKKLYMYLNNVQGRRRGAFIKEAMEMYIEMIELGYHDCQYLKPEFEENRFKEMLQQKNEPKEEQLKISSNSFDEIAEEVRNSIISDIEAQYQAVINDKQNNQFKQEIAQNNGLTLKDIDFNDEI